MATPMANKGSCGFPFLTPDALSGMPPDTPLLVAFSGGADSRLLLELTVEWAGATGAPVTAAHLHHGIRGSEADRDELFCREVCADLAVPLISERADIPARAARSGNSQELEARLARYEFFAHIMKERRIPLLLTAHHADDQLETLLLRLLRGSGVHGLGGIPPTREVPGGSLLRPLLMATRQEILDECERRGLSYVTDSTNLTDAYARNRLRHAVIPLMEQLTGEGVPQRSAARLAEAAREDDSYLCAEADRLYLMLDEGGDGHLSVAGLTGLHPALAKRCILQAYAAAVGQDSTGERSLSAAHLAALQELIAVGREGASVTLPGGWRGSIMAGRLVFGAPTAPDRTTATNTAQLRLTDGTVLWASGGPDISVALEAAATVLPPVSGPGVVASAVFPADLPRPLILRHRRPGDTIYSHGMTKKLKKVLCDAHIPTHLRDTLPLVCLPDGQPLWFPTAVFRDGYAPPSAGGCIRLTITMGK